MLLAVDFATHEIPLDDAAHPYGVDVADLDGDGDSDLLVPMGVGPSGDWKPTLVWYENENGLGHFGPQRQISIERGEQVKAADLDGDGDLDVLSESTSNRPGQGDEIAWYENTDGLGNFGPERLITAQVGDLKPNSTYAVDLDGDRDLDVLTAVRVANPGGYPKSRIVWYENTDGLAHFGPEQLLIVAEKQLADPYVGDLDGDGDPDLILSYWQPDPFAWKLVWFENTNGTFGSEQVIMSESESYAVLAVDLDQDRDLDLLAASGDPMVRWEVAWYENIDGLGHFGPQRLITTAAQNTRSVYAVDLDHDGDVDVLSASRDDDKIAWYENKDGQGDFGRQQVISRDVDYPESSSLRAADLDGDGDVDVLSASIRDVKLAWYENLLPRIPGDANRDGFFDTADLVQVLQAGEYEDGIEDNSTWIEGDWDSDFDFGTSDLVLALQTGLYEVKSGLNASEVAGAVEWLFTQDQRLTRQRAYVA